MHMPAGHVVEGHCLKLSEKCLLPREQNHTHLKACIRRMVASRPKQCLSVHCPPPPSLSHHALCSARIGERRRRRECCRPTPAMRVCRPTCLSLVTCSPQPNPEFNRTTVHHAMPTVAPCHTHHQRTFGVCSPS